MCAQTNIIGGYILVNSATVKPAVIVAGTNFKLLEILCEKFSNQGYDISLVYSDDHFSAKKIRRKLQRKGMRCLPIAGDFKRTSFAKTAIKQTIGEYGNLDLIVNAIAVHKQEDTIDGFLSIEKFKKDYYKPSLTFALNASKIIDVKKTPIANIDPNWDEIKKKVED